MAPVSVSVRNLCKTFRVETKPEGVKNRLRALFSPEFREVEAVAGISFDLAKGEKVAFLGPNGAGKSTTIKMLSGILSPTSGTVNVAGFDPAKERSKLVYRIGAVFGQTSRLWYHLSPRDSFELLAKLYELPDSVSKPRIDFLVSAFEIGEFYASPVRKLSLGQRMRAEVAASLIHDPEVLFLDEPTIGLDMIAKQKLRDVINQINRDSGTTILLTSHDIGDVEHVCDRVIIVNHGKIVSDGPLDALKKEHVKTKTIRFRLSNGEFVAKPHELKNREGDFFVIEIPSSPESVKDALERIYASGEIEDFSIGEPPLEEIIRTFY